ncbi:hypothetical protein B0H21DRAFT_712878 [Amylocystis lapponica]|nr:hypothetical protein B0H21DRAFT_712878 [Amylocystis lapponica]
MAKRTAPKATGDQPLRVSKRLHGLALVPLVVDDPTLDINDPQSPLTVASDDDVGDNFNSNTGRSDFTGGVTTAAADLDNSLSATIASANETSTVTADVGPLANSDNGDTVAYNVDDVAMTDVRSDSALMANSRDVVMHDGPAVVDSPVLSATAQSTDTVLVAQNTVPAAINGNGNGQADTVAIAVTGEPANNGNANGLPNTAEMGGVGNPANVNNSIGLPVAAAAEVVGQHANNDDHNGPANTAEMGVLANSAEIEGLHNAVEIPVAADPAIGGNGNGMLIISPSGEDYTPALVHRLNGMVTFTDPANGKFAICEILQTATWGTGPNDSIFCIANSPVTIYIVGEVRTTWFHTRLGAPQSYVNLRICPVRAQDLRAARNLLASNATVPPRALISILAMFVLELNNVAAITKYKNTVYAGRRSTLKLKGAPHATPVEFTKCYDAREHFQSKSAMNKWPVDGVGFNDMVLMECYMTRYRVNDEGMAIYRGAWDIYRAAFELQALSLIAIGADTPIDDDSDNEADVVPAWLYTNKDFVTKELADKRPSGIGGRSIAYFNKYTISVGKHPYSENYQKRMLGKKVEVSYMLS